MKIITPVGTKIIISRLCIPNCPAVAHGLCEAKRVGPPWTVGESAGPATDGEGIGRPGDADVRGQYVNESRENRVIRFPGGSVYRVVTRKVTSPVGRGWITPS